MNAEHVPLAELITRGMHSIHHGVGEPVAGPMVGLHNALQRRIENSDMSEDVRQLMKSTNGLMERLAWLPASASHDKYAMRRYILRNVERFISEISVKP